MVRALVERLRACGSDGTDIEAKASVTELPKSIRETVSAFANGGGGTVLLGVAEEEGFTVVGVDDPVAIRDALTSACTEVVTPPVRAEIEIVDYEGRAVVVAVVPEIARTEKPCYVRAQGLYTGSYIRTGDGDRHLTQYETGVLLANRGQPRDDAGPVGEASVADLDQGAVRRLLDRVRSRNPGFTGIDDEVALQRLRVLVRNGEQLVPSVAGLLALGVYPQEFMPQLHISFVVIPAASKDRVPLDGPRFLDNQTITGSLPVMIDGALRAITRNMATRAVVTEAGREDIYDYPLEALREAVVNALLHRDYSPGAQGTQVQIEMYSDRLVIRSPGGLYGSVTAEDLGAEGVSASRNSFLAMLVMDVQMPGSDRVVAENRGSGIPTMVAALRRAGMTVPVFSDRISSFSVTFPKHSLLGPETLGWLGSLGEDLTDAQHMAMALMKEGREVSNATLRTLGLDSREATAALRGLVERGLARTWGGRRYARYGLADGLATAAPSRVPVGESLPEPDLPDHLRRVLERLRDGEPHSLAEIAERMDVGSRSVTNYLNELIAKGLVEATAPPRSVLRKYRLRPR